ncbi:hypothetical protein Cni_G02828 [Canna indica]|uniref:MI domain-containing protein n=1 Tax=Canna indica TaxID=4628 RepID=A0AAQ3JQT0_9LILI|nr:hypothetical protein Cni_G02828 [Canna indica]
MDRKNREKEMASVLLSALSMEIFSRDDIVNGSIMLLESAEDTALDILDASKELALFLARAMIDDVLAPLNLEEISSKLPGNCSGTQTIQVARSLVSGERLLRCWGGGTGWAATPAAKDMAESWTRTMQRDDDTRERRRVVRGGQRWTMAASNASWRWAGNLTVSLMSGSGEGEAGKGRSWKRMVAESGRHAWARSCTWRLWLAKPT